MYGCRPTTHVVVLYPYSIPQKLVLFPFSFSRNLSEICLSRSFWRQSPETKNQKGLRQRDQAYYIDVSCLKGSTWSCSRITCKWYITSNQQFVQMYTQDTQQPNEAPPPWYMTGETPPLVPGLICIRYFHNPREGRKTLKEVSFIHVALPSMTNTLNSTHSDASWNTDFKRTPPWPKKGCTLSHNPWGWMWPLSTPVACCCALSFCCAQITIDFPSLFCAIPKLSFGSVRGLWHFHACLAAPFSLLVKFSCIKCILS